jgi:hypothetical protein
MLFYITDFALLFLLEILLSGSAISLKELYIGLKFV